jgi:hypothetical protein
MKIHMKKKDAVYSDEQAYCGTKFNPGDSEAHVLRTKIGKVTCRTCKKVWGKELQEKIVERSLHK